MKRNMVTCDFCGRERKREAFGKTFCEGCGHRADVLQRDCDCPRCRRREADHSKAKAVAA